MYVFVKQSLYNMYINQESAYKYIYTLLSFSSNYCNCNSLQLTGSLVCVVAVGSGGAPVDGVVLGCCMVN